MQKILSHEKNGPQPAGDLHKKEERNTLSFQVRYQLVSRLMSLKTDIERGKFTWGTLGKRMTEEMGHLVTTANLKGVLKDAGIIMPVTRRISGGLSSRLTKLENVVRAATARGEERSVRVIRLEQAVAALTTRLTNLEQQLGVTGGQG